MAKIHNVEQGSGEWVAARLGKPTASQFHKIFSPDPRRLPDMTPEEKRLYAKLQKTVGRESALAEVFKGNVPAVDQMSAQARHYAFFLIAEELMHESLNPLDNLEWIARGKELEPQAVKMYEFDQEVTTQPVGFITTDDGRIGASPDRLLIGKPAALELKCPAPHTHLEYLIDGFGSDYMPQVQGQAYVGEFEFVDRYSFHPMMPPALVRTYRDEAYIAKLADHLERFCDMLDELREQVKAKGYFAERAHLMTAVDDMAERQDLGRYLDA